MSVECFDILRPSNSKKVYVCARVHLCFTGEHYKVEEVSEQVQETLSSSSLRRKLFLDGHGSGSESSNPPSPERAPHMDSPSGKEAKSSSLMSPLQCDVPILTPSSVSDPQSWFRVPCLT